jgi:predicted RND superfamily exporter protein
VTDNTPKPLRLESSLYPTAIVHEGFFVYANPAFLSRLGYPTLEDLQAVPMLDLVDEADHDSLRSHLDAAKKTAGTDKHHPQARLTLRRADELPLRAQCTSFRTRYGGEDCVQLNLSSPEDEGVSGTLKRLPWRHYLSVVFLLLFTVLPSGLLLKLNINNAPTVYFPDDQPAVKLDRELRKRFPNDQVFVLLFEGVALYSDGFLKAYDDVGRKLQKLDAINEVLSLTLQDHIAGTEDEFIVEPLIDIHKLGKFRPTERKRRVLSDRFSRGALVSEDGTAVAMVIIPAKTGNSLERLALEGQILKSVEAHQLGAYLTAMAGEIPVDVAQLRSMLRDNMIFIPATVIIELLLVWWLFRRWLGVMLAGVTIGVVVNSTMAIYVLFDQPFTLVTTIIPPLLSALTVAALVHLFNSLFLYSRLGFGGVERVRKAIGDVEIPARYAALTTAAGLASLGTSDIIPIRVLGLVSAAGVILAYLVVYRVLPNILARWDRGPWPQVRGGALLIDRSVAILYRTGLRHPLAVIGVTCLVLAAGASQINKLVVETNFQEFFDSGHPIRKATRHIDKELVGTTPLAVVFDSDRRDGLKEPQQLALIRDFQDWLGKQPEVDRSLSVVDFIEEMNWGFHAEKPEFRQLPESEALISQYLFIYDGDDLYDVVDRDFQHSQVTLNLNVHSANAISAVIKRIEGYLKEHVGDRLHWDVAGAGRLFADMEDLLVSGQVSSLLGALVLIFLFMLFLFRSLGAAALCMIPNLSPIVLIFAIMGAAGIWLDMATAMIAGIAVGVAVDDTIHVFDGFQRRVRSGVSPVMALARTYRSAGRAVITTTVK